MTYDLEHFRGMMVMFCCRDYEQFLDITKDFQTEMRRVGPSASGVGWYNISTEMDTDSAERARKQHWYPDIILILPEYKYPETLKVGFPEFFE